VNWSPLASLKSLAVFSIETYGIATGLKTPVMKKRIGCLLVLLTIWPALCQALPDEHGQYAKLGVGNLECGLWTQARQSGDPFAIWWKTLILGWVQGFLTAYNAYGPQALDVTKGTAADAVAEWTDNYCVQHPHDNIAGAAGALVVELNKPRKKQLLDSPLLSGSGTPSNR
jgi:hypothetical protein